MKEEREIRSVLHDGTEIVFNTGDRVLFQASRPGGIPLAIDADSLADDLILTLEQRDEDSKQLMSMAEDWQRQCVKALVERDNLCKALEEARRYPRQPNNDNGWTLKYDFLEKVADMTYQEREEYCSMEQVEIALLCAERLLAEGDKE